MKDERLRAQMSQHIERLARMPMRGLGLPPKKLATPKSASTSTLVNAMTPIDPRAQRAPPASVPLPAKLGGLIPETFIPLEADEPDTVSLHTHWFGL